MFKMFMRVIIQARGHLSPQSTSLAYRRGSNWWLRLCGYIYTIEIINTLKIFFTHTWLIVVGQTPQQKSMEWDSQFHELLDWEWPNFMTGDPNYQF